MGYAKKFGLFLRFLTSTDARLTFGGIVISYLKMPSTSTSRKTGSIFSSLVVGCHIGRRLFTMNGSSIPISPGPTPASGGGGGVVVVVVEVVVDGRGRVWVTVNFTLEAVGSEIGESSCRITLPYIETQETVSRYMNEIQHS